MQHINSKLAIGLGAAALVASIAAVFISSNRQPREESSAAESFVLPELRDSINAVQSVTLAIAEDKPAVTLKGNGTGWGVQERDGYPADVGKLRDFLIKLADAKRLEQKTASPQRYADLGVEDTKDPNAKSMKVLVELPGKTVQLIVGNYSSKANGTFVRRPEEAASWLASGNLAAERDPVIWLHKPIVDIRNDRLAEIVLEKSGAKARHLVKELPNDTHFKLAENNALKELPPDAGADNLAGALNSLTLVDVERSETTQVPADAKVIKARFRRFDGLTIAMSTWLAKERHFARLSASLDLPAAEAHIGAEQAAEQSKFEASRKPEPKDASTPPAEGDQAKAAASSPPRAVSDPAKDRQERLSKLNEEVDRINERVSPWTFAIPGSKYNAIDGAFGEAAKGSAAKSAAKEKPQH